MLDIRTVKRMYEEDEDSILQESTLNKTQYNKYREYIPKGLEGQQTQPLIRPKEYIEQKKQWEKSRDLVNAYVESRDKTRKRESANNFSEEQRAQRMTEQYTPELTDIRRKEREGLNQLSKRGQPVSSYLSGSASSSDNIPYAAAHQDQKMHQNIEQKTQDASKKKWENAKKQYELDKIGFQSGKRFINYSTIPQRSDYETGIKEGMDKPNLFSNEIPGLMDFLDPEKREVSKASKYNFTRMNEDEKNIYYYLNGRFGAEAAGNYIKSINRELNARNMEIVKENTKELAKEHPVFSSVLDAAIAPVTAGAYPAMLVEQTANAISGKYEPMDPNDKYLGQAAILEGLRAGVAENEGIKNVIPNQTAREFLVGTGMSIGENIARLPFGAYGLAAAAGSAGLSGTRDAAERGGTTGQAVASGAVNAAAEAFFEKFSLDGLERFKVSPGRGVKEFLKNVGKQAITEGSEETATEIVNTLSDAVIMKELSQYNQAYQEYKKAGADDGTAKREAFMGLLKNVGLAGLGGAISGGIMGGGSQALGNAGLSYYGSKIDQDYRDYADSIDTDPAHYVRPEDTREAQELQRAAQEYAELQRQGRYVPNRDKAEYDIRMNRFMDNLQRRSQEPVRPQNTDEMPVDDKTTIEPEITGTEPINHQITENHVMPESVSKTPESVPQSAQAAEDTNQSGAYKGAYGKYGREALLDTYDGTVEVSVYNKAFGRAYDAGYHNMDLDMAEHSAIMSVLTDKQIKAAYRAGIQDYNADNKVIPQYTQGEARNGGLGSVSELAGQDQRRVADYIGKKTGLKINLIDSMEDGATASYKSGEITIDVGSKDFNGAMSHELTHFIKEQVPKAYEAYQTTVVEAEMKASGRSWEDLIESYERRYAEAGQELTRQEVIEEIVADATQKFFNDPQFIDAVIKKDKKLAQRIIDFLTDVVDSIKNLIQTGSTRAAAKNLEENAKLYEEARDIWMYGLEKAGESYKSGQSRERSSVPSTSEKQSEVESSGIILKDVRFQLDDIDETDENRIEALIYANKSLQEAYDLLEQQFKLTSKDAVRLEDIRKVSKEFLKKYNSKYSQEILEKNLSKLYSYIRGSDQIDGKAVTEAATSIAKSILKQSQQMDTELTEQYRDFRKQIRDTKISITDQDKADLAAVGGYNSFRKQYFGKMKLGKDGISVDSLYQELQSQYPELFPEDITHPADELIAIASALDQTEPQVKNPYHADMDEMSYILGQDIMQAYFDVRSPRATFADKKEAQLQKVRWQYQQKMRGYKDGLKKQYQDALNQVRKEKIEESERLAESYRNLAEAERQEMKDYYKSKMEKVRNEKWQAIDAITRKHQIKTKSMRDRRQAQYDKKIILKEIKRLQNWLLKPTDSRHIPEGLRTYVAEFLNNIDYSTNDRTLMVKIGDDLVESTIKSQRTRAWEEVQGFFREILDHGGVYEDPQTGATTAVEVDPDMVSKLKDLIQKTKDIDKLDDLDVYTMRELKETVYSMKKMIMEVNSLKSNQKSREVSQLAEGIFEDLSKRGDRTEYSGAVFGTGDKLLNYDMLDPQTMFGLMGNNMKSLYDSLRTGLDKKTLKLKEAQDYIGGILKENEITPRQLREWTGPDAKRKVFETSGGTIELSVAEVMSLYELDKRNQAKGHMYDKNGGIKREPKSQKAGIKGKRLEPAKIVKNYRTVKVKPADVIKITSSLTEEQKILADAMQRFMGDQCAAWGNEVTMDMYGYQKFTARNYFPIVTDRDYISTKQGEAQNQKTTIKNMGITKSTTPHAHNPIIIQDIFDVYTQQVDKMSTYNAYVIPLSDLNKVFNYRDARDTVGRISIKEEIDRAFGKKGNAYIDRLVQDINGGIIQDQGITDNLVAAWKTSAIAGNLRVAIQQPTAILRAMSEINPKYLLRGIITNTRKGQWKQMTNYAPIVLWKDWGFYKMDTSRQMKEVIFDTDSLLHRINNVAMIPAEMGDKIAWNRIWRACEFECMDKHKELKEGSEEFYQEVGRRFGEIIDRTQVVDSVLHRTQIMRSQNAAVKMATSFMAEPLKSYDMLYRAYASVKYKTPGASKAAAATGAYVISTVATALAASVMDAMRDDDREKGFTEKYVDNVKGNLMEAAMLINNIPYAKDIWATLSGDTPVRSDMAGIQDLAYAIREIGKYKKGSSKYTPQYVALYAMEHVSKTFGTPLGNVIRDVRSIADTIVHASDRREQDYLWIKNKYSMKNQANLSLYTGMMIEAQRAGDLEFQSKVKRDLNKAGIENDKIISRINALIKEELVTDEYVDPRIDAAAQARIAFDTEAYKTAVEQLKQEGYAEKMISSAVGTRIKELTGKEEIDWEAEAETAADTLYDDILGNDADLENDKEKVTYKPSYSSTDIIRSVEEIKEGDINSLKAFNVVAEDYYETKKKNGVKKKEAIGDLRSIITRKYKKEWISAYNSGNTAACEAIQNRLKHLKMNGSYLYSGKDWADWRKEAKEKKED